MIRLGRVLFILLSLLPLLSLFGCWNYKEVDDMSIVAGVALDKDEKSGKLLLTVEMVDTKGGLQQTQAGFKILTLAGDTMFDIVRNMISMTGKKLFWSHAKVIILSEEIAREGMVKVIDWYSRDTGTRSDVYIFVSKEKTAREILMMNSTSESIMSFELAQMMLDERNSSTAPVVEIWDFIDKLESSGKSAMAPLIYVHRADGRGNERVSGTAVFSKDKMVGMLSGTESKYMLFAQDKVKGGVLPVDAGDGHPVYSLEIQSSRTKVRPSWIHDKLQIQVDMETQMNLDEVMTSNGFTHFDAKKAIEERAEEILQENITNLIHKVQKEYHADVFGFGEKIHENMPSTWKKINKDWSNEFSKLAVVVRSQVTINSSAKTTRSIKIGD
ncbi:Ger(x)C family spore germination protein [Paenibacillus agri]|uniref:Ger(X)C family spore germination protein n=1 Tax=Paenibacillus agri TaxID=2744309 RepID=A0A850EKZ1_9BACL|nr:Ger(x)C family spore germination protein [Paenibacillus agri]NUU61678.1 Ger(x)C family spore germination protein [Paenibacillus agri]